VTGNGFEVRVCVCVCGRDEDCARILNDTGRRREEGRKEGGKTIHLQYAQIISKFCLKHLTNSGQDST
jgi:hypothetical protein